MHKFIFSSIALLACFLLFAACKKTNPEPASSGKSQLLAKSWKARQVSFIGAGTTVILYLNPAGGVQIVEDYSAFQLDFSPSGTYSGKDKNGIAVSGTWAFNSNETGLVLDQGVAGKEKVYTLDQLSESELVMNYSETSAKHGTKTITLSLVPVQ